MFEYITNPWWAAFIVMLTQFAFLYLRTVNIIYIAENKMFLAVVSGTLIGIMWLISITFSINAITNLEWQPIAGYLIGGAYGTYYAMVVKK